MRLQHKWMFKARLSSSAFNWKASALACRRLKEAVAEIKKVAKTEPVTAGDGAVALLERIWPSLQDVDGSSGALGGTVAWAQEAVLPIIIAAPADRKTRDAWLERLWRAFEEDGVDYLSVTGDRWGELCASAEVASAWADRLVDSLRASWTAPHYTGYFRATGICLSCLLAAGRHQELMELLSLSKSHFWHERKFGVQLLLSQGRVDEALAYANASRGMNQPDGVVDSACEKILLDHGRADEAYRRFALSANRASTGVATFRAIQKKYPNQDARTILADLASHSGDPGLWFAAAKDAGQLDLALEFARTGRTDPRTLSRASRDLLKTDVQFSLESGRLAICRIAEGYGYELTDADVLDACKHFLAAASVLGITTEARSELLAVAAENPATFSDLLIARATLSVAGAM